MDALTNLSLLEKGLLTAVVVAAVVVLFWFFNRNKS